MVSLHDPSFHENLAKPHAVCNVERERVKWNLKLCSISIPSFDESKVIALPSKLL